MKKTIYLLTALFFITTASHAHSADKVVVIPLNKGTADVPESFKTVSVSSMVSTTISWSNQDTFGSTVCGSIGKYYSGPSSNEFFNIPVHLPDGATITSFMGIFCDNTDATSGWMRLMRSDNLTMADVSSPFSGPTTTPLKRTDITINEPVIDNSQYAYYLRMTAGTVDYNGPNYYPISAHITLE